MEIESPDTKFSFQIMEEFIIDIVDNSIIQEKLISALNRNKPFRNFKYVIDNSGKYREMWFKFKHNQYEEWVKEQIEMLNEFNEKLKK